MNTEELKSIIVYLTDKVSRLEQENIALSGQKAYECADDEKIPTSPTENIINLFPNAKA
tara:strand:- start:911 stop:1087 length:177 start_codon:yes stop_codon:yes gene_type:complete